LPGALAIGGRDRREGGSIRPPKMAPRANGGDGDDDTEVTIKIVGGLPE
jgi:hypothetical protein